MQYVDGTDLQAFLTERGGKVSEDESRFLFQQLIMAVRDAERTLSIIWWLPRIGCGQGEINLEGDQSERPH
jgi:hypothetical protein